MKKVYRATITREQLAELLAGKSVEIFNRSDMVAVRINLESSEWCICPEEKDWKSVIAKVLPSTFYADLTAEERIEFMVEQWCRAITVNQQLEEENATLRKQIAAQNILK